MYISKLEIADDIYLGDQFRTVLIQCPDVLLEFSQPPVDHITHPNQPFVAFTLNSRQDIFSQIFLFSQKN